MTPRLLPLLLLLLAACATPPAPLEVPVAPETPAEPEPPVAPPEAPAYDPARVLGDAILLAQRVAAAAPEEQRRELQAAAQALTRERGSTARLRYGVLLALPGVAGSDPARAAGVLEPLQAAGTPPLIRHFAAYLLAQLGERQKEQKRAQQLKDQLDELRALERSLIERGQPKK